MLFINYIVLVLCFVINTKAQCSEGQYYNYNYRKCYYCSDSVEYCSKCSYSSWKVTCSACETGYLHNSENTCTKCSSIITGC